jgi:hypothetical protein
MKVKTRIITLLAVLAILGSLVAITAVPASALGATTFTPSPAAGPVGTPAAISLPSGTFVNSAALTVTFQGVAVTTVPIAVLSNSTGGAVFNVIVPARAAGVYPIKVTDGANTATGNFTVVPAISITAPVSAQGPVGTSITVMGTGFTAMISAFAQFEGSGSGNVTLGGAVTDAYGNFQVTGVVPAAASGNHIVWGYDLASPTHKTTYGTANNAVFKVTAGISVNPTSGLVGSSTAVSGSGWKASTVVTLTFGGFAWGTLMADAYGVVSGTLIVPNAAIPGVNQIQATDGTNTAATTFTLVPAGLSVSPNSGAKNTSVLITGNTFTSGKTDNVISIGNLTIGGMPWNTATAITVDTTGTMQPTTLLVPGNITLGPQQVVAYDKYGRSAIATFTVTSPTITINPTVGGKGTVVVINGSGWVPTKQVTITLTYPIFGGGTDTATESVQPDSTGSIVASMAIAADAVAGSATFQAEDTVPNHSNTVTFTIPGATITLTPTSGMATTSVTANGTGFLPYFPVTVKIGSGASPYTLPVQAITDATGAFNVTFQMPGLAPGVQVITVTEGTNTATTFFTITAAPVSIGTQLAGINTQLVRVWGYSGGTWYLYDPADVAGSDLTTLTSGAGYWIDVNAACTLVYGAYSYPLTAGWNLIGWR